MKDQKIYQKDWFVLIVIYVIALLFRIIAVYVLSWNRGPHFENYAIARYIVEGKGYWWDWSGWVPPQPTALLPPIYTYFLVIFMKLFTNPCQIIYISQAFLNALGIIPCFYLGKQLNSRKTGIIAALLYAVFPEVAITPTKLISEPLFVPCVILSFYLFLKFKHKLIESDSYRDFIWLGIFMGFTTLIKTTGSLIILAFFISLFIIKNKKKTVYMAVLLLGLGFFLSTLPWNIRNLVVMNKPMMLTSNFGYNLWRGNHPWGSGTGRLADGRPSESDLSPEYIEYLKTNRPLTEVELDKFHLNEAMRFIKEDPARYITLTIKRMFYFITFDPTHPLTKNIFYIGGYIFVLIFGIWGGIILKKQKKLDNFFIISALLIFLFYTPIIILPRYRLIVILILLSFSAVSVTRLLFKVRFLNKLLNSNSKLL